MTLLAAVFAAVAATAVWYCSPAARRRKVGLLALLGGVPDVAGGCGHRVF